MRGSLENYPSGVFLDGRVIPCQITALPNLPRDEIHCIQRDYCAVEPLRDRIYLRGRISCVVWSALPNLLREPNHSAV